MGKEYVEEVTSNDVLLTEKGRLKNSPPGNKEFRRILQGAFRDHGRCSSAVTLALHIVEKLKILYDPPMRLLQFDREARKYYQCNGIDCCYIIQKEFQSLLESSLQDKNQTNANRAVATKKKKQWNTKTNGKYQDDQNSNPNQIVTTPKPTQQQQHRKRSIRDRSRLGLVPAIISPPSIHNPQDEKITWHLPGNTATLPPLPLTKRVNKNSSSTQKTFSPSKLGRHASREMEMKWPVDREEFMKKVYVEEDDCMEHDILYRGGRNAEIELASDEFRICLQKHYHRYQQDNTKDDPSAKRRFHLSVLYGLRQLNPEVRFLKYDRRKGKYYEWNHREAIEVVLQQMERRSKASASSGSLPFVPLKEPPIRPQSADIPPSSRPSPTPAATGEETTMDVDETRTSETQSGRMTPISRGEGGEGMPSSTIKGPVTISPETSKTASFDDSPYELLAPTLPQNPSQNDGDISYSSRQPTPRITAATEEEKIDLDETCEAESTKLAPIRQDKKDIITPHQTNSVERTIVRQQDVSDHKDNRRQQAEESGNAAVMETQTLTRPDGISSSSSSRPNIQQDTTMETSSLVGSEMLPIEIDDDDDDDDNEDCRNESDNDPNHQDARRPPISPETSNTASSDSPSSKPTASTLEEEESSSSKNNNIQEEEDEEGEDTKIERGVPPRIGSEMLPIEIGDDDDGNSQYHHHECDNRKFCEVEEDLDDEEEDWDEEAYYYQEQMNRALEIGFQEG